MQPDFPHVGRVQRDSIMQMSVNITLLEPEQALPLLTRRLLRLSVQESPEGK